MGNQWEACWIGLGEGPKTQMLLVDECLIGTHVSCFNLDKKDGDGDWENFNMRSFLQEMALSISLDAT